MSSFSDTLFVVVIVLWYGMLSLWPWAAVAGAIALLAAAALAAKRGRDTFKSVLATALAAHIGLCLLIAVTAAPLLHGVLPNEFPPTLGFFVVVLPWASVVGGVLSLLALLGKRGQQGPRLASAG